MNFSDISTSSCKILVVGDIILDRYWFGSIDRISPEAPVPVIHITQKEDRLGGAANVAHNISALGARVTLLGIVGDDEEARKVKTLAQATSINANFVTNLDHPTTLKMRILGSHQQLMRIDFEQYPAGPVLDHLDDLVKKYVAEHDIIILSDYAKGALKHVSSFISHAQIAQIPILVDPKGHNYRRYHGATLISPNQSEIQQEIGVWHSETELTEKAQCLRRSLELEALLVTRSQRGMTLFTENGRIHINARTHEIFDVSGAGDTVIATLAVAHAAGLPWPDTLYWANQAASIVVGKLGTSVVHINELKEDLS